MNRGSVPLSRSGLSELLFDWLTLNSYTRCFVNYKTSLYTVLCSGETDYRLCEEYNGCIRWDHFYYSCGHTLMCCNAWRQMMPPVWASHFFFFFFTIALIALSLFNVICGAKQLFLLLRKNPFTVSNQNVSHGQKRHIYICSYYEFLRIWNIMQM